MLVALMANFVVAPSAINVMSFNVRYATANDGNDRWELRRDLCLEVIRQQSPDLLLLQEALRSQIDEIKSAVPGYAEVGCGREDGAAKGEYAAILFRKSKFGLGGCGWFWLSDTPTKPNSMTWGNRVTRICTWARFEFGGRVIAVYNTHLDHESQPSRERSVSLIADHMASNSKGLPLIFGGDFNAGESNLAIRKVTGDDGFGFVDSFRQIHQDAVDVGTFHAFKGHTTGEKIDYIFVSGHWNVLESEIVRANTDGRYPSDHFPVTARIELASLGHNNSR